MSEQDSADLLGLTARIVAAHVGHNAIQNEALPALIRSVYASLAGIATPAQPVGMPQPAVPVKRSVFPDYLVCLEDGKKLKMLKRHLQTSYGMTPLQYRERWSLPHDYPMVAPNYAERRSVLAKSFGLGRPKAASKTEHHKTEQPETEEAAPRRRGRKPGPKARAA
jgi:predicted transcriptional regulator